MRKGRLVNREDEIYSGEILIALQDFETLDHEERHFDWGDGDSEDSDLTSW